MKNTLIIIFIILGIFSCKDNPVDPNAGTKAILDSLNNDTISMGSNITIYGSRFGVSKSEYSIFLEEFKIDTTQITIWNDTIIQFHLIDKNFIKKMSGNLYLKSNLTSSNSLKYIIKPDLWITDAYPKESFYGDTITLIGCNLKFNPNYKFLLANQEIQPIYWDDNKLQFTNNFKVTATDSYMGVNLSDGKNVRTIYGLTAYAEPKLNKIAPTISSANNTIQITGENFGYSKDSLKLYLNDIPIELKYINTNMLSFVIPEKSISGKIKIKRNKRFSNEIELKIIDNPIIESLSKSSGSSGENLTINGKYFGDNINNVKVYFEDLEANIQSFSKSKIDVIIPDIKNCCIIKVLVEGVQSNEVLFQTSNCISMNNILEYKLIKMWMINGFELTEYSNDTLKVGKGAINYNAKANSQYQPTEIYLYFDKDTYTLKRLTIYVHYQYVDYSPIQSTSRIGTISKIYENISVSYIDQDKILYNIPKSKGTSYTFYENVMYQNYKYNTSSSYTNSGSYSLDKLEDFKIELKK